MAGKNVPETNGGSLRSRSTASQQPIFDFGQKMQFFSVKLGKISLNEPPFVRGTFYHWKTPPTCPVHAELAGPELVEGLKGRMDLA